MDDLIKLELSTQPPRQVSKKEEVAVSGVVDGGLCLFTPSKIEVGVKSEVKVDYYPLASIQKSKCIEFQIPNSNTLFFALNKSVLRVKARILHLDNSAPDDLEKVSFVNAPIYSMFRQLDLLVQQKIIGSEVSVHYPYKAILDYLVYTPEQYLNSGAQKALFFYDTAYSMDSVELSESGANSGLISRYEFCRGGREVLMEAPLAHDLTNIRQYLPNNLQVKIRLWPNADEFVIMSGEASESYKYVITDCVLQMAGVETPLGVITHHNKMLAKQDAMFYYERSVVKSYSIPSDLSSWSIDQFLQNEIPFDLLVCFTSSEAFIGDVAKNPFNFSGNTLNYLRLEVEAYQEKIFTPDFDNKHFAHEYGALFEPDTGSVHHGTPVKMAHFGGGYAIYRFKLGNSSVERLHRPKRGQSRLLIKFAEKLRASLTCVVYAKYHDYFSMDLARNVYLSCHR